MTGDWKNCKNILCIRPDNMGDLIMSGPAIRALKESFNAHITVLTSSMAKPVVKHMPEIDDAIIFDLPWVKINDATQSSEINNVVEILKGRKFDAAVIFTVYSQNPLPAATLAYLAGITKVLAYCRENPYGLLTHWVPDKEPYTVIKHQVRRDLDLVKTIGAVSPCENLCLAINNSLSEQVYLKLVEAGVQTDKPWLLLHAGVSEEKRWYPLDKWIETGKKLIAEMGCQIVLTGSDSEKNLTDRLQADIGKHSFSAAGLFTLDELICLVRNSPLMISVNTGTVHIAAATGTPVIVLYAQTNPQHTPWKVPCKVLQFPVSEGLKSKNEVIAFVNGQLYREPVEMPGPDVIISAAKELLNSTGLASLQFPGIQNENRVTAPS
jgi:lipopolysaccharide heptosyltransferase II